METEKAKPLYTIERAVYDQLDQNRKNLIDTFIALGLWEIIEKE